MTPERLQEMAHARVVDPPYDPACVDCRRAAGNDLAGTTWQCVGHVYRERNDLRAEIRRLTAERDEAREALDGWVKWASTSRCIYCGQEFTHDPHDQESADEPKKAHVLMCEAHPLRAAQAENATLREQLTTAQADLEQRTQAWAIAADDRDKANGERDAALAERDMLLVRVDQLQRSLDVHVDAAAQASVLREERDDARAEVARLTAAQDTLPPLPSGWREDTDGTSVEFVSRRKWEVLVEPDGISMTVPNDGDTADIIPELILVLRHAAAAQQRLAPATPAHGGEA